MPLTLVEIKSLIDALGIAVPEAILVGKAKTEEFQARRKSVSGDGSSKPPDWRFKPQFDGLLIQAAELAGNNDFESAFKRLEEAAQLLQQPDTPPPAPPAPGVVPPDPASLAESAPTAELAAAAEPAIPEESVPAEANPPVVAQIFQKEWDAAKQTWLGCLETIDRQLDAVRAKMLASGDPDFKIIADRGLPALTDNYKTPLMKALFELDGGTGEAQKAAASRAVDAVTSFRHHVNSFNLIRALDEHSGAAFGVPMSLRSELRKGLSGLEKALQSLTTI